MSTELDDETLQRFYDGDLSPVEERVVQARIEREPAAQRRLQELERLSAWIQVSADEVGAGLDSDAMFAAIERQIAADEKANPGRGLRVVAGAWASSQRRVLWPLVAVAAAAAVAMLTLSSGPGDEAARNAPKREKTRVAAHTQEAPARPRVHGTRVERVDFGNSTGTVFEIDSEGVATAVVWIADDEEETP